MVHVTDKDYKICDVLGGLDVTRLVSRNARTFFTAAIDDVELLREFLNEATGHQTRTSDFASLEEMAQTLDWKGRNLPNGTTTIDAGLGYTDDRVDRRIDRLAGLFREPLVGDKETEFFMMDALSPIFPWIVDRKSKETSWRKDHQIGKSQGDEKEPFMFDALYVAAWLVSYAEVVIYYPPMNTLVDGYPFTMADVIGSHYDSHEDAFIKPNLPENNPERKAMFTAPYPDVALEGVALITATAPVYFTGNFMGYEYDDTYVAALGVDIAVSSVSAFLDVLQDSLTPKSFAMLVDSDFNTIVISQEVVNRIYPKRTGMEEARITYDKVDGSIARDRRNQTYLPSDTIVEDLTKLKNADWGRLLKDVQQLPPGGRTFTTLDITLTGEELPTEFFIMFEHWEYVADWTLLVFAPTEQVRSAINVYTTSDGVLSSSNPTNSTNVIVMEGERGNSLRGSSTIVNGGHLDVLVSVKSIPRWIDLETEDVNFAGTTHILGHDESLRIPFRVNTEDLDTGTQSSAIVFDIQDADYPDCFFRQDLAIPFSVKVTAPNCADSSRVTDANGVCVCSPSSVEISGNCVEIAILVVAIVVPVLVIAMLLLYLYALRTRKTGDSIWEVKPSELKFDSPPKVIGQGSFGQVLKAEYRGTQVAVKQVLPPGMNRPKSSVEFMPGKIYPSPTPCKIHPSPTPVQFDDPEQGRCNCSKTSPSVNLDANILSRAAHIGFLGPESAAVEAPLFDKKQWHRHKSEFIAEMTLLSKLRHPCITTVMGAVVDKREEPMLVMEYMDHGSLYHVLRNETMALDGEILLPILRDIAQGVRFLHAASPKVIHGDLKAQNVLVDSRFRAKVADFGLSQKRQATGTLYWMAPELLRGESVNTTASDVYAFGIILCEVYSRQDPYDGGSDVVAVLQNVIDPSINRRPIVPASCPPGIRSIMTDCLQADPEKRPTFEELDIRLKRLDAADVEPRKSMDLSIQQSVPQEEKIHRNRHTILSQVFPEHIQRALNEGRQVETQERSMVTIFYSDIVDFNDIVACLPSTKVSDLLDRLYDDMDLLSLKHDVFKIETIGDAYMTIANLVKDQADHTKRIAQFAIDVLALAQQTFIDVDNPALGCVDLRIGFHSGPVAADVVGKRNPRYCLLGDTVHIATKMETLSEKNRIQCSKLAAALLAEQEPNIPIQLRGPVDVGKGSFITTFWVNEGTTNYASSVETSRKSAAPGKLYALPRASRP